MKLFLLILFISISSTISAQNWVGLELGGNTSFINFTNSDNVKDERIKGVPGVGAYLTYKKVLSPKKNQFKRDHSNNFLVKLGYEKNVAKNAESSILEQWSMDFLSTSLIFRHQRRSKGSVNHYFGGGIFTDYLLSGVQQSGFEQYNLTEDIKRINYGIVVDTGLSYWMRDDIYGTFGVMYSHGFANMEKTSQEVKISDVRISIAIHFELAK